MDKSSDIGPFTSNIITSNTLADVSGQSNSLIVSGIIHLSLTTKGITIKLLRLHDMRRQRFIRLLGYKCEVHLLEVINYGRSLADIAVNRVVLVAAVKLVNCQSKCI